MTGEFRNAHQCGAGPASRAATFLVTWWATDWWFEFCPYQEVSKVFATTEGNDGRGWYCLLQSFRDVENVVMFPSDASHPLQEVWTTKRSERTSGSELWAPLIPEG